MSQQRNLIFGLDPLRGLNGTFSWADVPDLDADDKGFSIGYVPRTKGVQISVLQETLFLGTINADLTIQSFRSDLVQDNNVAFTARAITNRIDPSLINAQPGVEASGQKQFWDIAYLDVNPIAVGATHKYARDALRPHTDATAWEEFKGRSDGARFAFNNGLARWIHLEIIDTASPVGTSVFGGFNLSYLELGARERGTTDASN